MTQSKPARDQIERVVIDCIVRCSGVQENRLTPDSDLTYHGIAGDDGFEIIEAIRAATGARLDNYDFYPHFGPEAAFTFHSPSSLTVRQLTAIVDADLNKS